MQARPHIKTRVFKYAEMRGLTLPELAKLMGVHHTLVYRVKTGDRNIGPVFMAGAKRAFPDMDLDDLFYVERPTEPIEVA